MIKSTQNKKDYLQMSVKTFIDDFIYRIDLDADYQRDKIWSTKEREDLLDSIIKGIDIPKMYLAEIKNNEQFDYECIDGKQRMQTLLYFFKPDVDNKEALSVVLAGQRFTYEKLKSDHPKFAKQIENYLLDFVTYKKEFLDEKDSDFVKLIFRRLQLGVRLSAGEILHAHSGPVKDFVFKEAGSSSHFFRNTNLSAVKRFSKEFSLAQICLNSFKYSESREYVRSRLSDLEDFFEDEHKNLKDTFSRIKEVLNIMDKAFGENAKFISSRAVAVSAYLFAEKLFLAGKKDLINEFARFYIKLLDVIKNNSKLLSKFKSPENPLIMEEFQKYISQASAESYSVRRRDDFLKKAFDYFLDQRTKGQIIGNK